MAGPEGRALAARAATPEHRSPRRRAWLIVDPADRSPWRPRSCCPTLPTPATRDLGLFLGSDAGQTFLSGNWGWFAIILALRSSTRCSARSCCSEVCCCPGCRASSAGGTGRPTACCSPPTTCTCRGSSRRPSRLVHRRLPVEALQQRAGRHRRAQRPVRGLRSARAGRGPELTGTLVTQGAPCGDVPWQSGATEQRGGAAAARADQALHALVLHDDRAEHSGQDQHEGHHEQPADEGERNAEGAEVLGADLESMRHV